MTDAVQLLDLPSSSFQKAVAYHLEFWQKDIFCIGGMLLLHFLEVII